MSRSSQLFFGKVALVTGAGGGIGKCICQGLASEGARVMVADINLEAAQATVQCLPGDTRPQAIKVDVASSASVNAMFATIQETCQEPATIVVHCAVHITPLCPLISTGEEDLDNQLRTNLKGAYLVTQGAARAMITGRVAGGAIVNLATMAAKEGSLGLSAYSAVKAGVLALTKVAAAELAAHGIRVNAVLPEVVDTPLIPKVFSAEAIARMKARHPLRRFCRPEEVAETVKFLCGPGSSCTSGTAVDVAYCYGHRQ